MKILFPHKTPLQKFSTKVCKLLVENFFDVYYTGGTVRDLLLHKNVYDIDISTNAKPEQVADCLIKNKIQTNLAYKKFGVVIATQGGLQLEITTFRQDLSSKTRYPKILYINSPKKDSERRDFTANALYLSIKNGKILDFQQGLKDIAKKQLRFIGVPEKRIKVDPLRIIRALRLALVLNFSIEKKSLTAIKKYFYLIHSLTVNRTKKEINKVTDKKNNLLLQKLIKDKNLLDSKFK